MEDSEKSQFDILEEGHEFPLITYKLEQAIVDGFIEATQMDTSLYTEGGPVPPMVLAARGMAAVAECVSVPPGSIHVSQELEFIGTVKAGETINCHAKVLRKQERGRLRIMTVGLDVFNEAGEKVMISNTAFMLPVDGE